HIVASPVHSRSDYVLRTQDHSRIAIEYRCHIFFGIFAAQAEEHASASLRDHKFLERTTWYVHLNGKRAVLATNAFPQSLITVEHDNLVGSAANIVDAACNHGSQCREKSWCIGNVADSVGVRIVVVRNWIEIKQLRRGDHMDARNLL